jgi:hypothetical protein
LSINALHHFKALINIKWNPDGVMVAVPDFDAASVHMLVFFEGRWIGGRATIEGVGLGDAGLIGGLVCGIMPASIAGMWRGATGLCGFVGNKGPPYQSLFSFIC